MIELGEFLTSVPVTATDVGKCKMEDGRDLQLFISAMQEPIIRCTSTGKVYHLRWQDICNLAVNVGISQLNGARH